MNFSRLAILTCITGAAALGLDGLVAGRLAAPKKRNKNM